MRALALLLLAACGPPAVDVVDLDVSTCEPIDPLDPPEEALLLVGGDGAIDVDHRAFEIDCCTTLRLDAALADEEDRIDVVYRDTDREECDCPCVVDVAWRFEGLEPGLWTVWVMQQAAQVQVD